MTKKVNGKQKGNAFERKIANELSDRFSDYLGIPSGFSRASDSGSFFGGTNAKRMETHNLEYATYGDIVCPRSFKFCIECKNYKTAPSLNSVLVENVKEWDSWISQSDGDAVKDDKDSLLIVKYNRTEVFVVFNKDVSTNISDIAPVVTYKDRKIYRFTDILTLPDDFFFNNT